MCVSGAGSFLCLGGKDKIAVFEAKRAAGKTPQYKGKFILGV